MPIKENNEVYDFLIKDTKENQLDDDHDIDSVPIEVRLPEEIIKTERKLKDKNINTIKFGDYIYNEQGKSEKYVNELTFKDAAKYLFNSSILDDNQAQVIYLLLLCYQPDVKQFEELSILDLLYSDREGLENKIFSLYTSKDEKFDFVNELHVGNYLDYFCDFLLNTAKWDVLRKDLSTVSKRAFNYIVDFITERDTKLKLEKYEKLTSIVNETEISQLAKFLILNSIMSGQIIINGHYYDFLNSLEDGEISTLNRTKISPKDLKSWEDNINEGINKIDSSSWKLSISVFVDQVLKDLKIKNSSKYANIIQLIKESQLIFESFGNNEADLPRIMTMNFIYLFFSLMCSTFNNEFEIGRSDTQNIDKNWFIINENITEIMRLRLVNDYSFTPNKTNDDLIMAKITHIDRENPLPKFVKDPSSYFISNKIKQNSINLCKALINADPNLTKGYFLDDTPKETRVKMLESSRLFILKDSLRRLVNFYRTRTIKNLLKDEYKVDTQSKLEKTLKDFILEYFKTDDDYYLANVMQFYNILLIKVIHEKFDPSILIVSEFVKAQVAADFNRRSDTANAPLASTFKSESVKSDELNDVNAIKVKEKNVGQLHFITDLFSILYGPDKLSESNLLLRIDKYLRSEQQNSDENLVIKLIFFALNVGMAGERLHNSKFKAIDNDKSIYTSRFGDATKLRQRCIVYQTKINAFGIPGANMRRALSNRPENLSKIQWAGPDVQQNLALHCLLANEITDESKSKRIDSLSKDYEKNTILNYDYVYEKSKNINYNFSKNIIGNKFLDKVGLHTGDVAGFDETYAPLDFYIRNISEGAISDNFEYMSSDTIMTSYMFFDSVVIHGGLGLLNYEDSLKSGHLKTSDSGDGKVENSYFFNFYSEGKDFFDHEVDYFAVIDTFIEYSKSNTSNFIDPKYFKVFEGYFNANFSSPAGDDMEALLQDVDKFSDKLKVFRMKSQTAKDNLRTNGTDDFLQVFHDTSSILNVIIKVYLMSSLITKESFDSLTFKPGEFNNDTKEFENIIFDLKPTIIDEKKFFEFIDHLRVIFKDAPYLDHFNYLINQLLKRIKSFKPEIIIPLLSSPEFVPGRAIGKELNPEFPKNKIGFIDAISFISRSWNSSLFSPALSSTSIPSNFEAIRMYKFLFAPVTSELKKDRLVIDDIASREKFDKQVKKINETYGINSKLQIEFSYNYTNMLVENLRDKGLNIEGTESVVQVPSVIPKANLDVLTGLVLTAMNNLFNQAYFENSQS